MEIGVGRCRIDRVLLCRKGETNLFPTFCELINLLSEMNDGGEIDECLRAYLRGARGKGD